MRNPERPLTLLEAADAIADATDVYVLVALFPGDSKRPLLLNAPDSLCFRLRNDPDAADAESYFYVDADGDLVLDPERAV
jgi:hypothetical protein